MTYRYKSLNNGKIAVYVDDLKSGEIKFNKGQYSFKPKGVGQKWGEPFIHLSNLKAELEGK